MRYNRIRIFVYDEFQLLLIVISPASRLARNFNTVDNKTLAMHHSVPSCKPALCENIAVREELT